MKQPVNKSTAKPEITTAGINPDESLLRKKLSEFLLNYNISAEAINYVLDRVTTINLNKEEIFSSKGAICDKIGLLFEGLLYASFSPSDRDDEKVSRFFYLPDNPIITSFESFSTGKPANESIIAIEPSYMMCLDRKDLYYLYDNYPEFNRLGRLIAEQSYLQAQQRIHFLQTLNGRERVEVFYKTHPDLFAKVDRQEMASYLKMNRNIFSQYFNEA